MRRSCTPCSQQPRCPRRRPACTSHIPSRPLRKRALVRDHGRSLNSRERFSTEVAAGARIQSTSRRRHSCSALISMMGGRERKQREAWGWRRSGTVFLMGNMRFHGKWASVVRENEEKTRPILPVYLNEISIAADVHSIFLASADRTTVTSMLLQTAHFLPATRGRGPCQDGILAEITK